MKTVLILAVFLALMMLLLCPAQRAAAQQPLDAYIEAGLQSNLLLQRKDVSLSKAILALRSAKSMYLPSLGFQAAYQTAEGGRNIPLPVGDMLNPVYNTLNQLTQSNNFPQIGNETINFLPRNYYDAHIRATMPILHTEIGHNKRIHEQQVRLSELETDTYKRELVKEIKVAYFNYLTGLQAVTVYRSALLLAEEGKRSNEKLVESGKGLPAYVLRSNSEVAAAQAKLTEAELDVRNARFYFNSLLNRPGDAEVDTTLDQDAAMLQATHALAGDTSMPVGREEIRSMATAIGIRESVLKMDKQFAIPRLNAFLDVGSQSEGFRFNDQTRYYLAGLQVEIPIFNGNRNRHQIEQSRLDLQDMQLQLEQTQQQLQLSNSVARHNLQAAWQNYRSAKSQLDAAEAYQRLISKGYQAGTNSYIETVDARSQFTAAKMALLGSTYQVLAMAARLERENASYPLTR